MPTRMLILIALSIGTDCATSSSETHSLNNKTYDINLTNTLSASEIELLRATSNIVACLTSCATTEINEDMVSLITESSALELEGYQSAENNQIIRTYQDQKISSPARTSQVTAIN